MHKKIIIPLPPAPQRRHRIRRAGSKIMSYDPDAKLKKSIKAIVLQQLNADERRLLARQELFSVKMYFYVALPKKTSQKALKRFSEIGCPPMNKKFDIDNLCKLIFDACNGVLWSDDRLIDELYCKKCYTLNEPKIIIEIC